MFSRKRNFSACIWLIGVIALADGQIPSDSNAAGNGIASLIPPASAASLDVAAPTSLTKKVQTVTTTTIEETTSTYSGDVLISTVTTTTTKITKEEATVNETTQTKESPSDASNKETVGLGIPNNSTTTDLTKSGQSNSANDTNFTLKNDTTVEPQPLFPKPSTPADNSPKQDQPIISNPQPQPQPLTTTTNNSNLNNVAQAQPNNSGALNSNQANPPSQSIVENFAISKIIFSLLNDYRSSLGLKTLNWNDKVYQQSLEHSKYQLSQKMISHDNFSQRAVGWRAINENVAMFSGYKLSDQLSAQQFMDMWKNSPGHNANMVASYVNQGAVAVVSDPAQNAFYATMENVQV